MRPIPNALVAAALLLAGCAASAARSGSTSLSAQRETQREWLREACLETMLTTIGDASTRAKFCDCSIGRVAPGMPLGVLTGADSSPQADEALRSALAQSYDACSRALGLPVNEDEGLSAVESAASGPSIVQVVVAEPARRKIVTGSGFFIADHLIATNHHVVKNHPTVGIAPEGGEPFEARVLYVDSRLDFAVLASPIAGKPLEIRDGPVAEGEAVLAWGFPQGRRRAALSSGTVRASDEVLIVHDALIAAGSSGGPLTDAEGKVLGIVTFLAKSRKDAANESDRGIAVRMDPILHGVAARAKTPRPAGDRR